MLYTVQYRTVVTNFWHLTSVADPDPDAHGSFWDAGSGPATNSKTGSDSASK